MTKHIDKLTYGEVIRKSCDFLSKKQVPSSKCDAEWIVSHVSGKPRLELYLSHEDFVPDEDLSTIRSLIKERGKRVPLQHIIKTVEFCNLSLKCDSRALIPRPETERLVELLIEKLGPTFNGNILDLGSGSGAIVLALCNHFKCSQGTGLDISSEAIALSKENLRLTSLDRRVSFIEYDWVGSVFTDGKYEVIVSNPPYLSEKEWQSCEPEVKNYDPKLALVSSDSGMYHIRKIVNQASPLLSCGGLLAMEIGVGQAEKVIEMMNDSFCDIKILKDFSAIRRFVFAYKN